MKTLKIGNILVSIGLLLKEFIQKIGEMGDRKEKPQGSWDD